MDIDREKHALKKNHHEHEAGKALNSSLKSNMGSPVVIMSVPLEPLPPSLIGLHMFLTL